jgi:hypothetical protein
MICVVQTLQRLGVVPGDFRCGLLLAVFGEKWRGKEAPLVWIALHTDFMPA